MNWYRLAISGTWGLAAVMATASMAAWSAAVPGLPPGAGPAHVGWRREIASPAPVDSADLAAAAAAVRDRDPFRWERKPTVVRFNPWEPVNPPAPLVRAQPSRPPLALAGIVGGPPWMVLLEGVPGREGGVLLRVGEEFGGIRLGEVRGDTVRVSGFDTTWTLTPRQAWH